MFHYDEQMTDLIFAYCRERLSEDPVPLDLPGDGAKLAAALDGLITAGGHDAAKVLGIFADDLAPAVISCDSPRFLSFIPAAPTKAALLFDMVVSCSCLQGTSWLEAAGAVAAENQVLRLLSDLAGFPPQAGGVFVSGGSAGNLSALVVARDTAPQRGHTPQGRPLVAVSDQAHSSIASALRVMGVGALVVPGVGHRLTGAALRAALAQHPDARDVMAVVATSGTTNAGLIDDLAGVAEVAQEHRLWMHVDGAYGGAGLFSPQLRPRYQGLEHADSFVVDPHKWLFAPFDCASLIYREPALARSVHTQDASYLDVLHTQSDWNPSDFAYHLTRRARGLALWFSLAVNGTDAYGDAVDQAINLARRAAARITELPHLELIMEPELSVVLFRRRGWGPDDYQAWTDEMLRTQVGFVTPTKWEGETVARFAFLHPDTTLEMVDEMLALTA